MMGREVDKKQVNQEYNSNIGRVPISGEGKVEMLPQEGRGNSSIHDSKEQCKSTRAASCGKRFIVQGLGRQEDTAHWFAER